MVLFVTGCCTRNCWYCPISATRRGKDSAYANDRKIKQPDDILDEAAVMSALGTGITGGEPFLVLDRVAEYCSMLKGTFGKRHHIHLYTGLAPAEDELAKLSGYVDEIRLHPPHEVWPSLHGSEYLSSVKAAKSLGFAIGIEVPSLPGLDNFIPILPDIDFLNINELEWSETNAEGMRRWEYELADNCHNAVKNASRWADPLLGHPKVHWCSSTFKDSVQLRERLKRIAHNTARPFDEITPDGTIIYGVLESTDLPMGIQHDQMELIGGHIEMAWWVLVEKRDHLIGKKYILERYPNNGMVVEVMPL